MTEPRRLRVLLLAQHVQNADDEFEPHGSGAHGAATLHGLRRHFEVLPLFAEASKPSASTPSALRRFVPTWLRGLRHDLNVLRADRGFSRRALTAAQEFNPDVVYARSEYLCLDGVRVAHRRGIPLVLEVNGLLARDVRTMYRSPLEPLGVALERLKHRRAASIVTVSPGLAARLEEFGAEESKIAVIPNSVSPARVREHVREPSKRVVIGWLGHLMRWHVEALELLIDVAPAVLRDAPDADFLVIGGGPGLDALCARAAHLGDRFRFVGPVGQGEVPALLDRIDVGVIPAVFDYAFPVKLVDFGAAGIPVVAPRSASLDEQLVAGEEYEPFEPDQPPALTKALVRLAGNPQRRERLGTALQQAVREKYTWDATGDALQREVQRVMETRRVSSRS